MELLNLDQPYVLAEKVSYWKTWNTYTVSSKRDVAENLLNHTLTESDFSDKNKENPSKPARADPNRTRAKMSRTMGTL